MIVEEVRLISKDSKQHRAFKYREVLYTSENCYLIPSTCVKMTPDEVLFSTLAFYKCPHCMTPNEVTANA